MATRYRNCIASFSSSAQNGWIWTCFQRSVRAVCLSCFARKTGSTTRRLLAVRSASTSQKEKKIRREGSSDQIAVSRPPLRQKLPQRHRSTCIPLAVASMCRGIHRTSGHTADQRQDSVLHLTLLFAFCVRSWDENSWAGRWTCSTRSDAERKTLTTRRRHGNDSKRQSISEPWRASWHLALPHNKLTGPPPPTYRRNCYPYSPHNHGRIRRLPQVRQADLRHGHRRVLRALHRHRRQRHHGRHAHLQHARVRRKYRAPP